METIDLAALGMFCFNGSADEGTEAGTTSTGSCSTFAPLDDVAFDIESLEPRIESPTL